LDFSCSQWVISLFDEFQELWSGFVLHTVSTLMFGLKLVMVIFHDRSFVNEHVCAAMLSLQGFSQSWRAQMYIRIWRIRSVIFWSVSKARRSSAKRILAILSNAFEMSNVKHCKVYLCDSADSTRKVRLSRVCRLFFNTA